MRNGLKIDSYGTQRWWKNGLLHNEDSPAVINHHDIHYWYKNGKRHRLNGPAIDITYMKCDYYILSDNINAEDSLINIGTVINNNYLKRSIRWIRCDGQLHLKTKLNKLYNALLDSSNKCSYGETKDKFRVPNLLSRNNRWYINDVEYNEEDYWIKVSIIKARGHIYGK